MEKLHELSRTTVLRRRDPANSRVLTAEKRQIRHVVVPITQVTDNALIGKVPASTTPCVLTVVCWPKMNANDQRV